MLSLSNNFEPEAVANSVISSTVFQFDNALKLRSIPLPFTRLCPTYRLTFLCVVKHFPCGTLLYRFYSTTGRTCRDLTVLGSNIWWKCYADNQRGFTASHPPVSEKCLYCNTAWSMTRFYWTAPSQTKE